LARGVVHDREPAAAGDHLTPDTTCVIPAGTPVILYRPAGLAM
jgi:hypothetical protein